MNAGSIYRLRKAALLGLTAWLALVPPAPAQSPAYIGFVYPAGGQQGTHVQVTLGGQNLDGVHLALVSGAGVQARVLEYNKRLSNQEMQLLNEQLKELKSPPAVPPDENTARLIARIKRIVGEYVGQPASPAMANRVVVGVTIAPDALPGRREIRLGTPRGLSNPLVFIVGQVPEISTPTAPISPLVTLGKEEQSLRRKRRDATATADADMTAMSAMMAGPGAQSAFDNEELRLQTPGTVNGQITPGAVDRFRFAARQGQRLVISVQARDLIPYMADAVPGWFQAVLLLCDAQGREVAYNDDYRFKPDPVILFEAPADGDYLLAIHDAIFRGREDFVYRLTVGELPFITSRFPLGGRVDAPVSVAVQGWNLTETRVTPATHDLAPGVYPLTARGKAGFVSNPVPYALDTLPEGLEREPNDTPAGAQRVTLPVIVNGRLDRPGDQDVFRFEGRVGDEVVAEVYARRLDSPLDSFLKLTDATGTCLAFNDDHEDPGAGLTTHHADSYLRARLSRSGSYYLYLRDTQHQGGEAYAYRLRLSAPQPDFVLRVVPSSMTLRSNSTANINVYVNRLDGFTNAIHLRVEPATSGFESKGGVLTGTQTMARITVKTSLGETPEPVSLTVIGCATNNGCAILRTAVPAEDRMQAFLWRHLVPAQKLCALVYVPPPPPPKAEPPPKASPAAKP
ncbi:MAG: hypothetical protein NTV49_12070 [Kiritimatiellaeota bacterium]|nr:hypothetical protein [Kiritimatiellota bacterium]